jgi:hypothetical protein
MAEGGDKISGYDHLWLREETKYRLTITDIFSSPSAIGDHNPIFYPSLSHR